MTARVVSMKRCAAGLSVRPFVVTMTTGRGWTGKSTDSTLWGNWPVPGKLIRATGEYEAALCPDVEFGKVAEAFGAYVEKLTDPNDVSAALRRCVDQVRDGHTALLHVRVTPF